MDSARGVVVMRAALPIYGYMLARITEYMTVDPQELRDALLSDGGDSAGSTSPRSRKREVPRLRQ
jgi:hypothetical protein